MSKIAFVIRMYQEQDFHGGGEKLFYNLIKRLKNDGHIVHVYCSTAASTAKDVRVINEEYDHNNPQTMEKFYDRAGEIIKNEGYDLVISENITPPLGMTFLQGHSLVNRLRKNKNPLEAFLYNFRKTKKQRIKYQKKWLKQCYTKIFAVSELLKQDIVENFGVSPDNITVIYPGVDLPECQAKPDAEPNDITTYGLLAPGFKIKGGFVFLKALSLLKKRGYSFNAKIVYPKYKKNLWVKFLVHLYNLKNNVEFLGYQMDTTNFYSSIDCLVVPSLEDTFNLAALEAMAHCLPVIISNNAGACEIINEGENGFVFNIRKNSAENLARKLMAFIDERPDLSDNARKTAEEHSWDKFYKRFTEEI